MRDLIREVDCSLQAKMPTMEYLDETCRFKEVPEFFMLTRERHNSIATFKVHTEEKSNEGRISKTDEHISDEKFTLTVMIQPKADGADEPIVKDVFKINEPIKLSRRGPCPYFMQDV